MRSLGFGTERVVWPVFKWPLAAAILSLIVIGAGIWGITQVAFLEDLRNVFAGGTESYRNYVRVTNEFVDPENETLILVEGQDLTTPENAAKLRDLQFELQLIDGVGNVFSLFALRQAPDENGDASLVVEDITAGLTPELRETIRNHPLLGRKLLSEDGTAALFVVTPEEAKAPIEVTRAQQAAIEDVVHEAFADSDLSATLSGFPIIRSDFIEILVHDQIFLNIAGAFIGVLMSLIVFRSVIGMVVTAVPAVIAGAMVLGGMGLFGIEMTAMSNVVPALVMILGLASTMHLTFVWRRGHDAGEASREAELVAQREVGPACMLTAITTALAFISLTISDVAMVKSFGWIGAVGTLLGGMVVLILHALLTLAFGRFWKPSPDRAPGFLRRLGGPCAAVCNFAIDNARPIGIAAAILFVVFGFLHFSVPPQHSIREHLPKDNPANAALGRIDRLFDGAFPIQVIIPLGDVSPTSPQGLERIGRVHRAVTAIDGVETPLSLWSFVEWLGGDPETAAAQADAILNDASAEMRSRLIGDNNDTLLTVSIREAPTRVIAALIDRIEAAAKAAGGDGVVVTGVAVITARESDRTISNLTVSLTLAIFAGIAAMMLAFRDWRIGVVALVPNALPILATGTWLFLTGRGMQYTSVLSLTIAFGIAVDTTIHYLNRFMINDDLVDLKERLIGSSRHVGPVLVGTTIIIVAGLSTTVLSVLPTVNLFGELTAATLTTALIANLIILPAIMSGVARRWFDPYSRPQAASSEAPARV